ncbi:TetR/AcrR family transcriptional regulator [uncultured Flavobacterium sp.]|uniref:TetR/AcrR family transcriptional regulator n=1 Tax=uncultured Flavobacterium sp. TaxID=165435 RepID=UPI0030C8C6F3
MKEEIIQKALDHFLKNGSKIITMDDIANEFGLSKKTLYTLFKNKEALITEAVSLLWNDYLKDVQEIIESEENPIEKIILIYKRAIEIVSSIEPIFIVSLKKYHNKIMCLYVANRNALIDDFILPLLEKAQKESQIDSNVNLLLFCEVNFKYFDERIWKNNFLLKYSKEEALEYFITRRIKGILSKDFMYLTEIK